MADNPREDKENPFYKAAKYIWQYPEPDDWGGGFDWIQQQEGSREDWRQLLTIKDQWLGGIKDPAEGHPGSGGILLFFRYFLKKNLKESGVLKQYDRFVITRSDYIHEIPHVPLRYLSKNYIWIPFGEDYGGYTDRQIITSATNVEAVLSIVDDIFQHPDQLFERMQDKAKWNIERFIKHQFDHYGLSKNIRRSPCSMYTVRAKGGHTRWSEGRFNEELGYYVKYSGENRSYKRCAKILGKRKEWTAFRVFLVRLDLFLRQRASSSKSSLKSFVRRLRHH